MPTPIVHDATPLTTPETDALRFLPEGPIPLAADGLISWVGIQHGATARHGSLNILDLNRNRNQSFELPGRPGFAFPCSGASDNPLPTQFVIGMERSLGFYDTANDSWTPFCDGVDTDVENTIINDGIPVHDNLIFGTKDLAFAERKAGLYLYRGRDQKLIRLRDDQVCSNGKMIFSDSSGQLKLIDIDTPTKKIVQYDLDIDAGTIANETTLVDLTDDPGYPDGAILTPDASGIIVSIYLPGVAEFGQTRLYDRVSGTLQCVWRTPGSSQNTCPALVVVDRRVRLIITTAVELMSEEARRNCLHAGQLFIAETDFDDTAAIVPPVYYSQSGT